MADTASERPRYDPKAGVVYARPLWLDTAFRIAFGPTSGTPFVFTGVALHLTLVHIESGELHGSFTAADFALSAGDTVARLVKDDQWVAGNLEAGWYEGHFWVENHGDHWAAFAFEAVEPAGGRRPRP